MCFRAGFNTYLTHLCISDKYTHLCKHSGGKEKEVVVFRDEEKEQEHVWEADMDKSELPSLRLPFLDFSPNPPPLT